MRACRFFLGVVVVTLAVGQAAYGGIFPDNLQARAEALPDQTRAAVAKAALGKWGEAAGLCERAVKDNPTHPETWLGLAICRHKAGQYREAIPAYEKALELRAYFPAHSAYNIACCRALLGENDAALAALQKALALGFRSLEHARNDADFKSLRDDPRFRELVALIEPAKMSRDEGWRFGLNLLAREIKRLHYNPFRHVTREQFDAHVKKLDEDIPRLKHNEILVGFLKLAALPGDGHTWARPAGARTAVPLQLFAFSEGVFVTAAAPEHAELAGNEVVKVGGRKTADVLAALEPVISRDNPMGLKTMGPALMTVPRVLSGLGLVAEDDRLTLTVRDAAGKERDVTLQATTAEPNPQWILGRKEAKLPEPLHVKNRKANYWFTHLPESKMVYFQYNRVRDDPEEPFAKFCDRLFKFIDAQEVERLVIDVRMNGGGNSFITQPLVHGVVRCDRVNRRGHLFVITGRHTFSAAQNASTDLEMHTKALFVGEPTGSSPNFIGEQVLVPLPYSKATASISDLSWQRSWPMDYRIWIAPHLYAPPSFALYRANRDPAIEAILDYLKAGNAKTGE